MYVSKRYLFKVYRSELSVRGSTVISDSTHASLSNQSPAVSYNPLPQPEYANVDGNKILCQAAIISDVLSGGKSERERYSADQTKYNATNVKIRSEMEHQTT